MAGFQVSTYGRFWVSTEAKGSGAPRGNRNAYQYGLYMAEAIAERRLLQLLIRQSRATIEELKG